MEMREALQILRERLDDNLLYHSKMMNRSDIGDIYHLQALAETHYYMKAVHDYTASEVEALLEFVDPLEVAYRCREENTRKVGLPICDLLKEIHADERFEKFEPDLSLETKTSRLIERLELNLYRYMGYVRDLSDVEITRQAERIAATMAAYSYTTGELMNDNLDESMIDHLYGLKNPLQYITDRWPECTLYGEDVLAGIQKEIAEQPDQPSSVHARLKDAQRKAAEQPKAPHGDTARKDKESR